MGVHGLWELLAPVGRRVSVDTLAGKKLAIDASIWIVQFMKAMRDDKGEMIRNAHLLGFLRRICKLLYLRTKPVFVFDGGTPVLKRRTVIARRRQRENAQAKIRKTAEKLLLNHLKAMKLKELANDLAKQREDQNDANRLKDVVEVQEKMESNYLENVEMSRKQKNSLGDKDILLDQIEIDKNSLRKYDDGKLDEMLAASLAAEEVGCSSNFASTSIDLPSVIIDEGEEELLLPGKHEKIDPVVLATLPPSVQLDLLVQMRERLMADNRQRYQQVKKEPKKFSELQIQAYLKTVAFRREIDEVQRAAVGRDVGGLQTSRIASEANREFIFSSSFSGDRQLITSPSSHRNADEQQQFSIAPACHPSSAAGFAVNEAEQEQSHVSETVATQADVASNRSIVGFSKTVHGEDNHIGTMPKNCSNSVQVSFPVGHSECTDSNENTFGCLVMEQPAKFADVTENPRREFSSTSVSGSARGEGLTGDHLDVSDRPQFGADACLEESNNVDESDVEWEEGNLDSDENSLSFLEPVEKVSVGRQLEDSDLQEALRRSLQDMGCDEDISILGHGYASENYGFVDEKDELSEQNMAGSDTNPQNVSPTEVPESEQLADMCKASAAPVVFPSWKLPSLKQNHTVSALPHEQLADSDLLSKPLVFCGERDFEADLGQSCVAVSNSLASPINDLTGNVDAEDEMALEKNANDQLIGSKNCNQNGPVGLTEETMLEEMAFLSQEHMNLVDAQRKLESHAESVSSEMFTECQELLQMFGLPYIVAPMEAEAQCAYMELANLVDGVVTDDSDVFLFGARSVYKNIFDDRKYVETYFMNDVENGIGLTREKLIYMALLLGSDYTEGVSGIGIVNAIEVVNAFPEKDGLNKFRQWIESPDPAILGSFVQNSWNNVEKESGTNHGISQSGDQDQFADDQDVKQTFMVKHRNVSKNWHIPHSFPSETVISAYSSPQVDKSTEPFSWGKPDLHVLRRLCFEKFGWEMVKSDALLLPVLNEYNKRETQLRLEAFYTFNERFAKIRSKRIKKAVRGITATKSSALKDKIVEAEASSKEQKTENRRRKRCVSNNSTRVARRGRRGGKVAVGESDSVNGDADDAQEPNHPRRSCRPRKAAQYYYEPDSDMEDVKDEHHFVQRPGKMVKKMSTILPGGTSHSLEANSGVENLLKMGGGFAVGEEDKHHQAVASTSKVSELTLEEHNAILPAAMDGDKGPSITGCPSEMLLLKRKRRKNQ